MAHGTPTSPPSSPPPGWLGLSAHGFYAVVATLFATVFALLTPPTWHSDEIQHYLRAQHILQGHWLATEFDAPPASAQSDPDSSQKVGGMLDAQIWAFAQAWAYSAERDERVPFPPFPREDRPQNSYRNGQLVQVLFPNAAVYAPLAYLPQVAGLGLGQWLGLSLFGEFLLARLFGALAQIALVYWALRMLPFGHGVMLVTALLPTSVLQSSALSADAMTMGVCMAWMALCLAHCARQCNPRADAPDSPWHYGALGLGMMAVLLVKPAYFTLTLLVFAIPACRAHQLPRWRTYAPFIALWLTALAVGALWYRAVAHINPSAHGQLQWAYVLTQPHQFLWAIICTFLGPGRDVYDSLLGRGLWGVVRLPDFFLGLCVINLTLATFMRQPLPAPWQLPHVRLAWGAGMLALFATTVALISYSIYVYFSPYMATSVQGMQGRYLLPVLPLLCWPLALRWAPVGLPGLPPWIAMHCLLALLGMLASLLAFAYFPQ